MGIKKKFAWISKAGIQVDFCHQAQMPRVPALHIADGHSLAPQSKKKQKDNKSKKTKKARLAIRAHTACGPRCRTPPSSKNKSNQTEKRTNIKFDQLIIHLCTKKKKIS